MAAQPNPFNQPKRGMNPPFGMPPMGNMGGNAMPFATPPGVRGGMPGSQALNPMEMLSQSLAGLSPAEQQAALQALMNPHDTFQQGEGDQKPPSNPIPGFLIGGVSGLGIAKGLNYVMEETEGPIIKKLKTWNREGYTLTRANEWLDKWFKAPERANKKWLQQLAYKMSPEETFKNWLTQHTDPILKDTATYQKRVTDNLAKLRKDPNLAKLLTGDPKVADAFAELRNINNMTDVENTLDTKIKGHLATIRRHFAQSSEGHFIEQHLNKLPEEMRKRITGAGKKLSVADVEALFKAELEATPWYKKILPWGESPYRYVKAVNKDVDGLASKVMGRRLSWRLDGLKNRLTGLRFNEYAGLARLESKMTQQNIGFLERKAFQFLQHFRQMITGETSGAQFKGMIGGVAAKAKGGVPWMAFLQGAALLGSIFNATMDAKPGDRWKTFTHEAASQLTDLMSWQIGGLVLETLLVAAIPGLGGFRLLKFFSCGGVLREIGALFGLSQIFRPLGEKVAHFLFGKPQSVIDEENKEKGVSSNLKKLTFNGAPETPTSQQFSAALGLSQSEGSHPTEGSVEAHMENAPIGDLRPPISLTPAEIMENVQGRAAQAADLNVNFQLPDSIRHLAEMQEGH